MTSPPKLNDLQTQVQLLSNQVTYLNVTQHIEIVIRYKGIRCNPVNMESKKYFRRTSRKRFMYTANGTEARRRTTIALIALTLPTNMRRALIMRSIREYGRGNRANEAGERKQYDWVSQLN